MSTTTRPRQRTAGRATGVNLDAMTIGSPEAKIAAARKQVAAVKREIATIMKDDTANRSTRDQRAYRKARDGFYRLADILSGK